MLGFILVSRSIRKTKHPVPTLRVKSRDLDGAVDRAILVTQTGAPKWETQVSVWCPLEATPTSLDKVVDDHLCCDSEIGLPET